MTDIKRIRRIETREHFQDIEEFASIEEYEKEWGALTEEQRIEFERDGEAEICYISGWDWQEIRIIAI